MASLLYTLLAAVIFISIFIIFYHRGEGIYLNVSRWKNLFIAFLVGFPIISITLNNDFWFIQPLGHVIREKGFVTTEPLSMHSGLEYVCQQWGFAVIIDVIYQCLGIVGCMLLGVILSYILEYVIYRICLLLSKDKTKSLIITSAFIALSVGQLTTRPYVVTAILLATELLLFELTIQKKNWKYLLGLPVISIVLINIQCSMWFMQFVFALPYIVDAIHFPHKEKLLVHDDIPLGKLLLSECLVFVAGFVNPYGLNAMTYIFKSYGIEEINRLVNEMHPFSIDTLILPFDFYLLFLVFSIIYIYYRKKKNTPTIKLRYLLLVAGTLVLTFLNVRSQILFIIAAPASVAYAWGLDGNNREGMCNSERIYNSEGICNSFERIINIGCCILIIISGILMNISNWTYNANPEEANSLYHLVNFIDDHYKKDARIFTTYDDGGYLEYRGYKPYIDARAEVFLKNNNKKYDYFQEFFDLYESELDYNDFFEKYNFDVIIVGTNMRLNYYLEADADYAKLYTSKDKTKNLFVEREKIPEGVKELKKTPLVHDYR